MNSNIFICFAPILGLTHEPYRRAFHSHFAGIDMDYAPFIKVQKGKTPARGMKNFLPPYNPAAPLIPQILSNDADEFLVFDQHLQSLGYQEFNWNLGCPVAMVTQKKRGSGLLPHIGLITAILEKVLPNLQCRLSIKLRLGLNHPGEILDLIPVFNRFPIQELIIHPRLGKQMYRGHADLASFAECLRLSAHPVVFNGDVFNVSTWQTLQNQFPGVQRWMLGRGLLANPFLAAQIKGLELPKDKPGHLQRFHDAYTEHLARTLSGSAHTLDKLKGFWNYLHWIFKDGPFFFHRLCKTKNSEQYRALVEQFFRQEPVVLEHLWLSSEDFRS